MSRMSLIPRSLRFRLIAFLLLAFSLSALVQGGSAYRTALQEADEIFDYHMQQMAFSLQGSVGSGTVSLPLGDQKSYDFMVQVWGLDGVPMFRSPGEALLPQRAVLGFSNLDANGKHFRVFSLQTRYQVVQVAQDLAVRQRMAGQLAFRTIAPIALMLPLLALVVWWVVSQSLEPVAKVRDQLAARAVDDLSPVASEELPAEVKPLVDELNSLLGRVRQAFEAQQHFIADAAHELRSPLAALKLQLQSLQRAPDAPGQALAIGRLASGIERASHLIEQLMALAREQAPGEAQQLALPLALDQLCKDAVVDISDAAAARQIDLGLTRCDAAQVRGEPQALRMLLRNLLDNAVKYSPEGGRVDVSLLATPDEALLVVEDSGPGIAVAERERVFDRFYRSADAQQASGSGLGLAIVKAIAERHGARLTLGEAAALGGLRVELRLPRIK